MGPPGLAPRQVLASFRGLGPAANGFSGTAGLEEVVPGGETLYKHLLWLCLICSQLAATADLPPCRGGGVRLQRWFYREQTK